jgi:hypothetical protein
MAFDPSFIGNLILIGTALASAFIIALWFSLIIWTYRDARQRVRYWLIPVLAAVVVGILFLPGVIVYLILRPSRTFDEAYQQALEEEALLNSIEENNLCPGCSRKVQVNWIVCPNCHTQLRKPCARCGKAIELAWDVCPYCATSTAQNTAPQPAPHPIVENHKETEKPIFL